MIRHLIMKLIEQIKNKRTDILIICLLSSSNDLRTSCSKYQLYIYFIFCACWSLFTSLLLFESIRWKFGQVTKHRKITIIFWFLSLFWRIFWAPLQMMTPSIFFYVFISDFEYKGISILMKPWSGEKRKWWQDILMFILTRAVTAAAVHLQHCEKTWGIIIIISSRK